MPGHAVDQQIYDEQALKMQVVDDYTMAMPMDGYMLPHRLFDSSPEKSDQGQPLEGPSSNEEFTLECDSSLQPEAQVPESPRDRPRPVQPEDRLTPLVSASPAVHILCSPTPATPKRPCYVPETPSPDRMHCSYQFTNKNWLQQPPLPCPGYGLGNPAALPAMGGLPCYYGQAPDQVFPEFNPMMPCMPPSEGAHFGDLQALQSMQS